MHGQDTIQPRINHGHHPLIPNAGSHLSQPIYFLPGYTHSPSMRQASYVETAEPSSSAFPSYMLPGPVLQTPYHDLRYSHVPLQSLRPVSSSSSGSPDEILMTPFLVQGSHGPDATPYLSYLQAEPTYTPSVMPIPMGPRPKAASGTYAASTGRTSSASTQTVYERHTEDSNPKDERPIPPPLRRRHTDSLPFSDSPLKRPTSVAAKPYGSPADRLRRPLSAVDHPMNSLGMGSLRLDNSYVAKQRIACQGCREKKLKCTGAHPVCYNCSKKGRTMCQYVSTVRRRGPGKKRLAAEARAVEEGYYADSTSGIPAQYAFWAGGDGQS
ncbi:hypothetical protein QFC22_001445 [Naganishia vaughanmartiniae]|uniref:Uncharacterized protein n=1 Tax=Naganishia vaughanmartiniae TaxID=1424756 RepID=A0ACC2XGT9_9TREE|nr:hypothetical protein QFC22_001445 [Naganishia vaughanmartiniae]